MSRRSQRKACIQSQDDLRQDITGHLEDRATHALCKRAIEKSNALAHQVNELVVRNGLVIEDASSQDTTIGQNTLLTLRTQVGRQRCTDGGIELAFTLSENTMSRICISIYSARRVIRQTPTAVGRARTSGSSGGPMMQRYMRLSTACQSLKARTR